jgi:hypothetical protein
MRTIFVVGMILVAAFMAGWFTIQRDEEGTTIRINRDEIRGDTRQAIDRGREFLEHGEKGQFPAEQVAEQPYGGNLQQSWNQQPQNYQQLPSTDPRYQNQPYQSQPSQPYPPRQY